MIDLEQVFAALPARRGHFLLESGYHTDLWLDLDALFVDPSGFAPLVAALAERIRAHRVSAVCGPLTGGGFLAQAAATTLGVGFYYAEPVPAAPGTGLFEAEYRLPEAQRSRVRGLRVAVVDDAISAGSSVRATMRALSDTGASTAVVAALLVTGEVGAAHFAERGVPLETLARRELALWEPRECPLCRAGTPLDDPRQPSGP